MVSVAAQGGQQVRPQHSGGPRDRDHTTGIFHHQSPTLICRLHAAAGQVGTLNESMVTVLTQLIAPGSYQCIVVWRSFPHQNHVHPGVAGNQDTDRLASDSAKRRQPARIGSMSRKPVEKYGPNCYSHSLLKGHNRNPECCLYSGCPAARRNGRCFQESLQRRKRTALTFQSSFRLQPDTICQTCRRESGSTTEYNTVTAGSHQTVTAGSQNRIPRSPLMDQQS